MVKNTDLGLNFVTLFYKEQPSQKTLVTSSMIISENGTDLLD